MNFYKVVFYMASQKSDPSVAKLQRDDCMTLPKQLRTCLAQGPNRFLNKQPFKYRPVLYPLRYNCSMKGCI